MPLRRPSGRAGAFILALAIAAAVPSAARAQSDLPNELKTVADVRFEGRRQVSQKDIRSVLKTRRRSFLPWRSAPVLRLDFLRADTLTIETLYRQRGYLDAKAHFRLSPARDPNQQIVTFVLEEGGRSRIAVVELVGVQSVGESALRRKLHARDGRWFNPLFLVADTTIISAEYQERGRLPHVTGSYTRDANRVTVRYEVIEGPVYRNGQAYVSTPGEVRVRENVIRRELVVRPGDTFRASRVQLSVERLYETGLFSQVQMTPLIDSTNTQIEFDVRVRERKPRWIDAGVGSGTTERFRFTGQWGHRNLVGRGLEGILSAKLALDGQARFLLARADAALVEPWLLRSRTRGILNTYFENNHDRSDPRLFVELQTKGVNVQLRRQIGRITRITLTQDNRFVINNVSILDPTVSQAERDSLTQFVVGSYTIHRIQLGVDRDSRDDPIRPARGSLQTVATDVAGGRLRGASNFKKVEYIGTWYTPLGRTWVLATRLRAGAIDPFGSAPQFTPSNTDPEVNRVPFDDRFWVGGVNSVRGYNEKEIPAQGGLATLLGNVELRVPVAGPFGLELYVDAGNVWSRAPYLKGKHLLPRFDDTRMDPGDVRYVAGIGARLELPVGPARVDFTWGRPDENGNRPRGRAQFAIGPSF